MVAQVGTKEAVLADPYERAFLAAISLLESNSFGLTVKGYDAVLIADHNVPRGDDSRQAAGGEGVHLKALRSAKAF